VSVQQCRNVAGDRFDLSGFIGQDDDILRPAAA